MDSISLNLDNSKVKFVERSRGRMKIQVKLNKEEAEGFKNFMMVKPPELDEDTFFKQIFFAGCNVMFAQIQEMINQHKDSHESSEDPVVNNDEQTEN